MAGIPKPSVVIRTFFKPSPPSPAEEVLTPALIGPLYRITQYTSSSFWDGSSDVTINFTDYNAAKESIDVDYILDHSSLISGGSTVVLPIPVVLETTDTTVVTVNGNTVTITNLSNPPLLFPYDAVWFNHNYLTKKYWIEKVYGSQNADGTYNITLVTTSSIIVTPLTLRADQVNLGLGYPTVNSVDGSVTLHKRMRSNYNVSGVVDTDLTATYVAGSGGASGTLTIDFSNPDTVVEDNWIYVGDTVTVTYDVGGASEASYTGTIVSTQSGGIVQILFDSGSDPGAGPATGTTLAVSYSGASSDPSAYNNYSGFFNVYARFRVVEDNIPIIVTDENSFYETYGNPTPDNPMSEAIKWIRLSAAGSPIYIYAVDTDDATGYAEALKEMYKERKSYTVVPLTDDTNLIQQVFSAIKDMNNPYKNIVKRLCTHYEIPAAIRIAYVDTSANSSAKYVSSSTAPYITGIDFGFTPESGDIIVLNTTDYGALEFTVTNVSGSNIFVEETFGADISNTPTVKITSAELKRSVYKAPTQLKTDIINYLLTFKDIHGDVLIGHVYGEDEDGNLQEVAMKFTAAAYAGMIAGYPPQVHFNLWRIPGIVYSDRLWDIFDDSDPQTSELNDIAGAGGVLIVQDTKYDYPYIRNSITTDTTSIRTRSLSIVKSVDYIRRILYSDLFSIIQRGYNIGGGVRLAINLLIQARLREWRNFKVDRYGPLILDGTLKELTEDRETGAVKVVLSLTFPTPLERIDLELYVE